jgi:glycosyltransferase involved in cell wall biosynthesis
MQGLELRALRRASLALVCSEPDRDRLHRLVPNADVAVLANAAPIREPLPLSGEPVALFLGAMRYGPNLDALRWLVREIWPLVRRALPVASLIVAGDGSAELGIGDAGAGIEALGFAGEVEALYRRARVALCPLRSGGGTRIKIIEAAMFGRPSLSTALGAEGLNFVAGREIALADGPAELARSCVDLLRDPSRAAAMGAAARRRAKQLYGESAIMERLAGLCRAELARGRGA